jgi:murein DD-endopeptidase MepM/ murein hydrolase activator NlpD
MSQKVQETAQKIVELKKELDQKKNDLEVKKAKNEQLKAEQVAARQGIESQRAARDVLLQETKGQESNYQAKLKEAQQREATAWSAYMDSIRGASASDGSTYNGGGGTGYLSWPLRGYVSQGYGCTEYAMCGNPAGPYGGNIHNGLDIATFSGDPIHAAADGYVLDEGYAYNSGGWGNWIIIKHPNGLATLYAHQTSFAVTKNQAVKKGQVIGYEGNTGNSTGPHLHFSVFTSLTLYDTGSYHGPNYNGTTNPYNFL